MKRGRKSQYVKIAFTNGKPILSPNGSEIEGLHFDKTLKQFYLRSNGKKKWLGVDLERALKIVRPIENPLKKIPALTLADLTTIPNVTDSKQTLSDCLNYWIEYQTQAKSKSGYIAETKTNFNQFVSVVQNKPVNQLSKTDFAAFDAWLVKQNQSNDWFMRRKKAVRAVLKLCFDKTDYPLPPDLWRMFNAMDSKKVVVGKENKLPLPPKIFKAMVSVCQQWASLKPKLAPDSNEQARAVYSVELDRQRQGKQWLAILHLACNCSLGNVDIATIKTANITNGVMTFPRTKQVKKIGASVERITPLAPLTVKYLKAWLAFEPSYDGYVFHNRNKGLWTYDDIGLAFRKIKEASGNNTFWSFKHLRNIGPTVRRDTNLPADMSEAILGDTIKGISKFYTGGFDFSYLAPLVEAIAKSYFGD